MLKFIQENIKWLIAVVAFIFGIGVAWGIMEYKISTLQKEVANLKIIKEDVSIIKGQNEILLKNIEMLMRNRIDNNQ